MRFVELCGGIGGISLAMEREGFKCVGYYEIDKYAVKTYNKNFGTSYEPKDIREVKADDIPDHEVLCAGFPCQSFSIAGERMGFKDTRGTLFFEIARIIKGKQPQIVFLENVKGLLSHDKGRTFACILATLDELGYNAEWQVLNSKHFGIPQHRERIFIVGYKRGTSSRQIFPIRSNYEEPLQEGKIGLELLYDGDYQSKRIYSISGVSPTIPTSKTGGNHIPFIADVEKYKETDAIGN